jgi:hypothetical protein
MYATQQQRAWPASLFGCISCCATSHPTMEGLCDNSLPVFVHLLLLLLLLPPPLCVDLLRAEAKH